MAYAFKRGSFGDGIMRMGLTCAGLVVGHVPLGTKIHFDASGSAVIHSAGAVSEWKDRYGHHVTQSTSSKKPTRTTAGINGLDTVSYDGGDILVKTDACPLPTPQQGEVWAVCSGDSKASPRCLLAFGNEGATNRYAAFYWHRVGHHGMAISKNTPTPGQVPNYIEGQTFQSVGTVYLMRFKSDGSAYMIELNGAPDTPLVVTGANDGAWWGDMTSPALNNMSVGGYRSSAGDSQFHDGQLGEVMVFDRALDPEDVSAVERYLAIKWGLTLS